MRHSLHAASPPQYPEYTIAFGHSVIQPLKSRSEL